MIAEFSIVPIDKGVHLSKEIAPLVNIVKQSSLEYTLTPMATIVEGTWDEIMGVIEKCHEEAAKSSERLITTIRIDDHKGRKGMIKSKVASVEKRLGEDVEK